MVNSLALYTDTKKYNIFSVYFAIVHIWLAPGPDGGKWKSNYTSTGSDRLEIIKMFNFVSLENNLCVSECFKFTGNI